MIIDRAGYRLNVGIILMNESGRVFLGKRLGHDAWQFPQGGLVAGETAMMAMFRELHEEIGLGSEDVEVIGFTKRWLRYRLPKQYLRLGSEPLVIGQKQKWFLLRLKAQDQKIRLDLSDTPEFDSWRWVEYDEPQNHVIFFKRQVYVQALKELALLLHKRKMMHNKQGKNSNKTISKNKRGHYSKFT